MTLNRREFIGLSLGALVSILAPNRVSAQDETKKYDISYFWDEDLEKVIDAQDTISKYMGPELSARLIIVKKGNQYGIIYDRDGDEVSSKRVATAHNKIISAIDLEAQAIKDEGYTRLYNVSYGKGNNLDILKKDYATVRRLLGEGVGKDLFIEETPDKEYKLIWRRRGNLESTIAVADRHAQILKKNKYLPGASYTPENNNEVVWGMSSQIDTEVKEQPIKVAKPQPVKKTKSNLETEIEAYISNQRNGNKLASDERTAWYVYDINSGEEVVSINKDLPLQSASMVKPLVALAYFHKLGKAAYTKEAKGKLEQMIQRSNNSATNWFIEQVGGPAEVDAILHQHYGNIFKNTKIVEKIPAGGRTYQNKSSAADYGRFLQALFNNQLPYSKELKRAMALPGRDRLYFGANKVPTETLVYNKTGSTAMLCGDMGILVAKGNDAKRYPYIIVGMVEKGSQAHPYMSWLHKRSDIIRGVSNLTYEHLKEKHDLI